MPSQNKVCVVKIKNSVVDNIYIFEGDKAEISKKAEKKFLELCSAHISDWDEYTYCDREAILDNGYEEIGGENSGNSICICWPSEEDDDE